MAFIEMDFASGGGGSLKTYATLNLQTTEEDLKGKPITITLDEDNAYVVSATFGNTKEGGFYKASAKLQSIGNYTIECGDISESVTVTDLSSSYEVEMMLWLFVIRKGKIVTENIGTFEAKAMNIDGGSSRVPKAPTITQGEGYIETCNVGNNSCGIYISTQKIDTTNYSKVHFKGFVKAIGTGSRTFCELRTTNTGLIVDGHIGDTIQSATTGITDWVAMDRVFDIVSPYSRYVGVATFENAYCRITDIYLTK